MEIIDNNYILELLKPALDYGVTIEVYMNNNKEIVHNLKTMAKSDLELVVRNNKIIGHMRYGKAGNIETFEDILYAVKDCMCGRDYLSFSWEELLKKYNLW